MSEHTASPHAPTSPGAQHPVSIGHLVVGVALLGLSVIWALMTGDIVATKDIRFLLPAPWIVAGVAGLVALVAADRRTRKAHLIARDTARLTAPSPPVG